MALSQDALERSIEARGRELFALVGRQPFGGFKMSGVGSKAGGPDYLLQFMDPCVTSENTMRRGFAPARS